MELVIKLHWLVSSGCK